MTKSGKTNILLNLPLDRIPGDALTAIIDRLAGDGAVHTGTATGANDYAGTDGIDTLYVDYLLPLNSPSADSTSATIALDASLAGLPYGFSGSQLDGSTITGFENLAVNVSGAFDEVNIHGDNGANELTVNISRDFHAASSTDLDGNLWSIISVYGREGDDIIRINRSMDQDRSTTETVLVRGGRGDDTIYANAPNVAVLEIALLHGGDDTIYLGKDNQYVDYRTFTPSVPFDGGDDRIFGFTRGEDRLGIHMLPLPGATGLLDVEETGSQTIFHVLNATGSEIQSVTVDAVGLVLGSDYTTDLILV